MTPNEIKGHLILANCRQVDLADELGIAEQTVGNIIRRKGTSDRVQRAIAAKIGRPVEEVFPDRYQPSRVSPRRALKRQRMAG